MDENKLRQVKVTYSDGTQIETSMAEHLTDEEINSYFRVGRWFNVEIGERDNMQQVAKCEIIK